MRDAETKIKWHLNKETRLPFGDASPLPEYFEPLGFPPPYENRPWIFANMVASKNGVVAWKRKNAGDDPVAAILGELSRPERAADLFFMRYLRTFGDMSVGAETNRRQPNLVQTPQEDWERGKYPQEIYDALYRARHERGLSHHPRNIIYSPSGRLNLDNAVFNHNGVEVIIVTTAAGATLLKSVGVRERGVKLLVEGETGLGVKELIGVHERLFLEHGARYLNCEGGETILRALHEASLLDEVFVTISDTVIDEGDHEGVLEIFDFEKEGADLVAEGTIPRGAYTFRRWRFNKR